MIHAPEIDRIDVEWLNTDRPMDLASVRGRLILLDFWTYCCVNCLHVIPVLHALERQFEDKLVVIGVHSPKFTNERNPEKVKDALERYGVAHPVIHDPERKLWDAYAIRAWPTLVLISADGYIIGKYPGEPRHDGLEILIAQALAGDSLIQNSTSLRFDENEAGAKIRRKYSYPSKIKSVPNVQCQWALTDTGHHQVVLINDQGEEICRYGSGHNGLEDGPADTASLNGPEGLCCTASTIYVADTRNHSIRLIDLESGKISTLAGTGKRGGTLLRYWGASGQVSLASPWDIERVGDRLFFANAGTHQVGELRLKDGCVRLAAGNGREGIHDGPGPQAELAQPSGVVHDKLTDTLYILDSETSSIRSLDLKNRWIETLVGSGLFVFGDAVGSLAETRLQHPLGLAFCDGKIYIADTYNNAIKILDPQQKNVTYLDSGDFTCVDRLCLPLSEPAGIACTQDGRVLVVDTNNHRVLEYSLEAHTSSTWSS